MDIVAAIQNSIEIVGKLRALAKKVQDADFKMLVADLSNELADAKLEVATLKAELAEAKAGLMKDTDYRLAGLKAEVTALRAELEAKRAEVEGLRSQASVMAERLEPTEASKLSDVQEKLLLVLAEHERLEEDQLASVLGIGKQVAAYHAEELRKRNFVHATRFAGSEWTGAPPQTEWSIQHSGREYLVRRRMIS